MFLKFLWMIAALSLFASGGDCRPGPDSAGVSPLRDGRAYGGIPYGSVSGQLSLYFGDHEPLSPTLDIAAATEIQIL